MISGKKKTVYLKKIHLRMPFSIFDRQSIKEETTKFFGMYASRIFDRQCMD